MFHHWIVFWSLLLVLGWNDTNPHCQKCHAHDKPQHCWCHGIGMGELGNVVHMFHLALT